MGNTERLLCPGALHSPAWYQWQKETAEKIAEGQL